MEKIGGSGKNRGESGKNREKVGKIEEVGKIGGKWEKKKGNL